MSYLDNLTQGVSNTYSQIYRKPRYTQIGNTNLQTPKTISLDQMYGAPKIQTAMPQLQTPQYTIPTPSEGIPATGQQMTDEVIEAAGYTQYQNKNTGLNVWMPTQTAEGGQLPEGMQYDNTEAKWVWSKTLNTWLKTELKDGKYTIKADDQPYTTQDIGSYANKVIAYTQAGAQTTQDQYQTFMDQINQEIFPNGEVKITDVNTAQGVYDQLTTAAGQLKTDWEEANKEVSRAQTALDMLYRSHYTGADEREAKARLETAKKNRDEINGDWEDVQGKVDYLYANIPELQSMEDAINNMPGEDKQLNVQSWQDQMNTMVSDLEEGKWTTETGIDIEAMKASGDPFAGWMAGVLEKSYKTGSIMGDFLDEEGNLAPELQAMGEYFQTPEQEQAYNKFSRELAFNAIAKGQSLNSGYYSNYVADIVANRSAEMSGQIADVMTKEIEGQYTYIAKSLQSMLKMAGRDTEAEALAAEMDAQFQAIQQQYQQEIDLLAQQVAGEDAARTGDIITGVLGAILSIALSIF